MVVSVNWAQVQYFVGHFDGTAFTLVDGHPSEPLYVDKGLDYYAVRTFRDYDRTLPTTTALGWVATWDYAPQAPSTYGKGFWSVPRNLSLRTTPDGLRLFQQPFPALDKLRSGHVSYEGTLPVGVQPLPQFAPKSNVYELDVTFDTSVSNVFGLNLCVGHGRKVGLSYDTDSRNFVIDRTHCTTMTGQELEGKVLVMSPYTLKESYWAPENQLWLAGGGFGCSPTAAGRAVYATCLGDGEHTRWNREDFIGILDEQHLPAWAQSKLDELRPAQQEQTAGPVMGGMTME